MRAHRQAELVEFVRRNGAATVAELCDLLGASTATVRRDLDELDERGLVERIWGGARALASDDDAFAEALQHHEAAKRRIARATAELVPEGATVMLDIGTTVYCLAPLLHGRDLTVITPSLSIFDALRDSSTVRLVLPGGVHMPRYQALEGHLTATSLAGFTADLAIIGCSGISARGQVRDTSDNQAQVKRALLAAAARTVLVADASKFPGRGAAVAFPTSQVNDLVTDLRIDQPFRAALGCNVIEVS